MKSNENIIVNSEYFDLVAELLKYELNRIYHCFIVYRTPEELEKMKVSDILSASSSNAFSDLLDIELDEQSKLMAQKEINVTLKSKDDEKIVKFQLTFDDKINKENIREKLPSSRVYQLAAKVLCFKIEEMIEENDNIVDCQDVCGFIGNSFNGIQVFENLKLNSEVTRRKTAFERDNVTMSNREKSCLRNNSLIVTTNLEKTDSDSIIIKFTDNNDEKIYKREFILSKYDCLNDLYITNKKN